MRFAAPDAAALDQFPASQPAESNNGVRITSSPDREDPGGTNCVPRRAQTPPRAPEAQVIAAPCERCQALGRRADEAGDRRRDWRRNPGASTDDSRPTLHHAQKNEGTKIVMIASALGGEGKTLTAVNLAL
jgi:Mrp family chromosome partitioning ATPase